MCYTYLFYMDNGKPMSPPMSITEYTKNPLSLPYRSLPSLILSALQISFCIRLSRWLMYFSILVFYCCSSVRLVPACVSLPQVVEFVDPLFSPPFTQSLLNGIMTANFVEMSPCLPGEFLENLQ